MSAEAWLLLDAVTRESGAAGITYVRVPGPLDTLAEIIAGLKQLPCLEHVRLPTPHGAR